MDEVDYPSIYYYMLPRLLYNNCLCKIIFFMGHAHVISEIFLRDRQICCRCLFWLVLLFKLMEWPFHLVSWTSLARPSTRPRPPPA